jgi:hypothetical protein
MSACPWAWRGDNWLIPAPACCRYIPAAGRFLIVCTFMEDAIRIMTQWNDQLLYLKDYRHSKIRMTCFEFSIAFTVVVLIDC